MRPANPTGPAWIACSLALAAGAAATGQESVTLTTSWVEVIAGTNTPVPAPDGILAPGEAARIEVTATITPGVGSTVTYSPPPGPGTGTLAGLWDIFFGMHGAVRPEGTWTFRARHPAFVLGGWGQVQQSGGLVEACQAGQFILPPNLVNPMNPIPAIWSGVWTPLDYTPRVTTWAAGDTLHGRASIYIQFGTDPQSGSPLYTGRFVSQPYGPPTAIPIIPAPAAAPLLLLALVRCRARRSAACSAR